MDGKKRVIYNSRNYSRLPNDIDSLGGDISTIVEIIQGYPTPNSPFLPNLRLNDGIFSLFFVYYIQSF